MSRQAKSLVELREILGGEIGVIQKKIGGTDEDMKSIKKEVANTKSMVERGIALPSRQADLERTLRSYHANRLDIVMAILRARQNIAETTRNSRASTTTSGRRSPSELQSEQAVLDQLG